MATKKNDLHKFTKISKIEALLKKEKISKIEFEELAEKEKDELFKVLSKQLNEYKDDEKDELLKKIDEILPTDTKNQIWENNHFAITQSMSNLIEEMGKMPTKNLIAKETGLSRQTIHKHLKNYTESSLYADQIKQFKFMSDRVLAKVLRMAVEGQGNVKAARLYFEVMGNLGNQPGININTQNNYIQINQTKLSQETIKQLTPEQLNQIEAVLKSISGFTL